MFWITLGLGGLIFWVALETYWQAQRVERARRLGMKRFAAWVQGQLPRGINVQKTVAVDYRKGIAPGLDWSDDFDSTQHLGQQDSGFRFKP